MTARRGIRGRAGLRGMIKNAARAFGRGRFSKGESITLAFLERAQRLAIRRAARDAHRASCDRDADECPVCAEHARCIAEAKRSLNGLQAAADKL